MNYIILGRSVTEALEETYERLCAQYRYSKAFDSYLRDTLSFDGVYKLYDRCSEETTFQLIGKGCMLYMEPDKRHRNCFYGRRIRFFEKNGEYSEKLAQTWELPGEWDVVQVRDASRLDTAGAADITDFLSGLKASYQEYYEFEGKWKTWDLYNTKLREREEQEEIQSERGVREVFLEHHIFSVRADSLSESYEEDADISVIFDGESRFRHLGCAAGVDRRSGQMQVVCENPDILKAYAEKRLGKIRKMRVVDRGTLARLRRQREAMKILFQGEAANRNLKEIIMGGFPFPEGDQETQKKTGLTAKEAYDLFGSNLRQKEAYEGAVSAPDIYLIQGPPGTGKTTIITELVRHAIRDSGTVLVSSETNIAVDNVLERIQYMGGVVPVRLGREERIDEACIPFLPDRIAQSILANAKARNARLDEEGVNLDTLLDKCREKWEKEDAKLKKETEKIRDSIHTDYEPEQLLKMINDFEELVYKVNEMYEQIEKEKKPYTAAKERLLELSRERAGLQEQLYLEAHDVLDSGFGGGGHFTQGSQGQIRQRLSQLDREKAALEEKISHNPYGTLTGAYQRKIRRFERKKQVLAGMLGSRGSLLSAAHQIKTRILDMKLIEEQRKELKISMEAEQESLATDYRHKQELWERSRDIRSEWMEAADYIETKEEIEKIYMKQTNAVFATCSGIASADNGGFAAREYDYVIIDEAAKCNMMDILIPLVRGKKIILVGDHKQLYPMLETEELKEEISEEQLRELREHILFKWLYEEIVPQEYKIMLNRQYRMEKSISEFVSEYFYGGGLLCEKETANASAMTWIDCENSREESKGNSYFNTSEAKLILRLLRKLDREYKNGVQVGVICTYKAQADYVKTLLQDITFQNICVECSTVDAFQGKEKHTIVFDIVRSSQITKFVRDENRVNVAVSRAQEYCYVVGSIALMKSKQAGILGKLYQYIRVHGDVRNGNYLEEA